MPARISSDFTGLRFGKLVAIRPSLIKKDGRYCWLCKCDCGNSFYAPSCRLKSKVARSCGCLSKAGLEKGRVCVVDKSKKLSLQLIGQKFGRLTVIKIVKLRSTWRSIKLECKCDCGKTVLQYACILKGGHAKSCGCLAREKASSRFFKDLTGKIFGNLKVINRMGTNKNKKIFYKCKCTCGNHKNITGAELVKGTTTSCGCYRRTKRSITSSDPESRAYMTMRLQMAARNRRLAALSNVEPVVQVTLE